MQKFRMAGERFTGSERACNHLQKTLTRLDSEIFWPYFCKKWPFFYDKIKARNWLLNIRLKRSFAYIDRLLYKIICKLRQCVGGSRTLDSDIFYVRWVVIEGHPIVLFHAKNEIRFRNVENGDEGMVPEYTAQLKAAFDIFPEQTRPMSYEGSAVECCIDALAAIRINFSAESKILTE